MDDAELINVIVAAISSGVAAEILRRVIPGTKNDSKAVRVLGIVSKVLTLGTTAIVKGDGRLKKSE